MFERLEIVALYLNYPPPRFHVVVLNCREEWVIFIIIIFVVVLASTIIS
jgi:hypothetical protein